MYVGQSFPNYCSLTSPLCISPRRDAAVRGEVEAEQMLRVRPHHRPVPHHRPAARAQLRGAPSPLLVLPSTGLQKRNPGAVNVRCNADGTLCFPVTLTSNETILNIM